MVAITFNILYNYRAIKFLSITLGSYLYLKWQIVSKLRYVNQKYYSIT